MAQSKSVEQPSGLKRIFSDLSFPQVTAGALAAVTSMLLASNVGIAGTVIGVAVSSVVSAVASQVYKQFILASAEKVKDLAPVGLIPSGYGSHRASERDSIVSEEIAAAAEKVPERRTRVFNPYETRRTAAPSIYAATAGARAMRTPGSVGRRPASVTMGDEYARSAILQARAARERKAKIQRNTIIVAVASAVVAVAVCALMINVATQGKGLGPQMPTATYVQKWSSASSQQEADSAAASGEKDSSGDEQKQESNSNSSQTDKTEGVAKPGSNAGSADGSVNVQVPQTPGSTGATGSDSNATESGAQDDKEDAEDSSTDGSSANSKPTGTIGSGSSASAR